MAARRLPRRGAPPATCAWSRAGSITCSCASRWRSRSWVPIHRDGVSAPASMRSRSIATPRHDITIAEATPADAAAIEADRLDRIHDGAVPARSSPASRAERSSLRDAGCEPASSRPSRRSSRLRSRASSSASSSSSTDPDASVYWHLTAVAPEWQGKGVGMSLWRTMLLRHRAEGASVGRDHDLRPQPGGHQPVCATWVCVRTPR